MNLVTIAALAVVYFFAAKSGLRLAFVHASATPVWPPTGIALASLLILGRRVWPGVFLGAFLANVTTAGTVWTSLGIASGNTLEGLVGAWLVLRLAGGRSAFEDPLDVLRFAALAGLASPAVSATFGALSITLGGFASWADFPRIWTTWWTGDAGGALLVAPFLMLWANNPSLAPFKERTGEELLLFSSIGLTGGAVFNDWFGPRLSLEFACTPPILWAAFRFGPRKTATACLLLSALAIHGTLLGKGPFAGRAPNVSLLLLQAYMSIFTVTALTLAAAVKKARRSDELAQLNDALIRSNNDLEQFAYVASHDLQEPLRKVKSFSQLLAQKYRSQLDEEAVLYIDSMGRAVDRMTALIRDLLAYSKVGQEPEPVTLVDFPELMRDISDDMQAVLRERGAEVEWDGPPVVTARRSQLRRLLQNLIGNAVKFSKEPPRVRVTCRKDGREWAYAVSDNGIGIDPAHFSKIFVLFQRLHARNEYPGTGIGLAICKKIVERQGGAIWVESEPGKGSTFRFTLPV